MKDSETSEKNFLSRTTLVGSAAEIGFIECSTVLKIETDKTMLCFLCD
jgi:hypothetical protein